MVVFNILTIFNVDAMNDIFTDVNAGQSNLVNLIPEQLQGITELNYENKEK